MLLDTNILIYAASHEFPALDKFLSSGHFEAASVTRIEAFGHTRLNPVEKAALDRLFESMQVLPLDAAVVERAIALRQRRKMSLGDAVIAATALEHDLPLVTRNVDDYKHVTGLDLINPFA